MRNIYVFVGLVVTVMGDSVLQSCKMLLYFALIWIFSSAQVNCQECSTTGLDEFGGYHYVFYHGYDGVYRTFAETRALCQSMGGDAAVITSEEQNAFITGRLTGGTYWIGLEDMDDDGTYIWIDGTTPGYQNWDTSLSTVSQPYCVVITSLSSPVGKWDRRTCTSDQQHICQIPSDGCSWQELGESQYLIKAGPIATIDEARATCQSYGGDLAMIKTSEINTFIKELLPSSTSSDPYFCYWFGLRRDGGGEFTWLDGTRPGYYDWYQGMEPNNANSWGCLGVRPGPTWYDYSTTRSYPYICERTRVFNEGNEASFGGIDYFISPSWLDRSYSDARTYCQYHGADLALIKSEDINTFVHGSGLRADTCSFFGLTDQATEGTFTWIDGTPLQYSPWSSSDPNGGNNVDCVCLRSDSSMKWWDVSCNNKRPFICERYQVVPEYAWSRVGGTEYYISQSSMTSYSFAQKFCQAQGGDLAQPKTEEINIHLNDLAEGNSYWFGLDTLTQADTLQWIDGTSLDNNAFPTWSGGDATFMENERCIHQQVNNGWRKLPCTSYLRFACEKPPSPRSILPLRLMAATPSPYGGGQVSASFLCLLGSESEQILSASTRRLFRLTTSIDRSSYAVPGDSNDVSSVAVRYNLPATTEGVGFFECSSVTASRMTSIPLGIILSTHHFQPSDGRFTKTIHVGDNITLSVITTASHLAVEASIRWRNVDDEAFSIIETSSGSLSHTMQFATVSDAGVYATYEDGMFAQRQYSFIRLIVNECPRGRRNPPLCDRLCDTCYNGGVCHQLSGTCICPPGFAGNNCLQACGMHRFGWDCEFECGPGNALEVCAGSHVCLPDPYGCNCLAGYTGIYCNETCSAGMFGADCLQECRCADGADCDDFTGECREGCLTGWSGTACQVPSVCGIGYFGTECTQKCNCRNGTACDKDSGFCAEVDGLCDLGYITDSMNFPSNCMTFSGCYSSCSKTCHCSGGADNCNFLTGSCLSSTCHSRWMGEQCQTDRFLTNTDKSNPGVAIFSCAFTVSSGQAIASDYVKAVVGTFAPEHWISHHNSEQTDTTLNNSFTHVTNGPEEAIYCFIGLPENSSDFAFMRLPPRDFFVLPSYNGAPEILDSGYYHVVMGWRRWDPVIDIGDGPVVGYKIYVRSGSGRVLVKEVQPPSMDSSIMKRSATNVTGVVVYNVSGLEAGTMYTIQIAAIRDGLNGEGEQGPPVTITTETLIAGTTDVTGLPGVGTTEYQCLVKCDQSVSIVSWILFGISIVGNIVLAGVIVLLCLKIRRTTSKPLPQPSPSKVLSDASPDYENPVFDSSMTEQHNYQYLVNVKKEANYEEISQGRHADYVNTSDL